MNISMNKILDETLKMTLKSLKYEVNKLAASDLIDTEKYRDNEIELAKILVSTAMIRIGNGWKEQYEREVDNLLKF